MSAFPLAGRTTSRAAGIAAALLALLVLLQLVLVVDSTPAASQTAPVGSSVTAASARVDVAVTPGSRFGTPESIGDVNGDGITDLAVGAYSDDTAGEDVGAVWVLFMAADGSVASQQQITAGVAGFGGELLEGGAFGFRIAGVGDLDRDGVPDMAVSAYRSDRVGEDAGEVWMLFLNADGTVKDWQVITTGFANMDATVRAGDQFGVDVTAVGDLNNDGNTDLAVGMWRRDAVATDDGAVLVLFMRKSGKVKDYQEISSLVGWVDAPMGGAGGFGVSVDGIGDLNGDGTSDLAVGSIGVKQDRGKAWILFLAPNGTVAAAKPLTPGQGLIPAMPEGARFGSGVAGLGDANGDGNAEVAVGAFGANNFAGTVWVLSLDSAGTVVGAHELPAAGVGADDLYGHTVAAVGDLDGDGAVEVAVGSPGDDDTGEGNGALYLVDVASSPAVEGPAAEEPAAEEPAVEEPAVEEPAVEEPAVEEPEEEEPVDPEGRGGKDGDLDGDGIPNGVEGKGDIDADGIPNREDLDTDGDGIPDSTEGLADADGDGIADFVEIDDDGDGVLTIDEGQGDIDGDGVPNHLDPVDRVTPPPIAQPDPGATPADDGNERGPIEADVIDLEPSNEAQSNEGNTDGSSDSSADDSADQFDDGEPNDGASETNDADAEVGNEDASEVPETNDTASGEAGESNDAATAETGDNASPDASRTEDADADAVSEQALGPIAVMDVSLSAPSEIVAGEAVAFELQVVNRGPNAASGAMAEMIIPEGVVVNAADVPEDCDVTPTLVRCEVGDLQVAQTATRTIKAEVLGETRQLDVQASVAANEGSRTTSTGPVAVLDREAVEKISEGLRSEQGAAVVVVMTALVCFAVLIAVARERRFGRKPAPRH